MNIVSEDYPYHIIYSDGVSISSRGPFQTFKEAHEVFFNAPVMPGQGAYLMMGDEELVYYYNPQESEDLP